MAARRFAVDDPSPHSGKRLKDITGEDILRLVEGHIRTKADRAFYKDLSFVDDVVAAMPGNKSVVLSMRYSAETAWEVKCIASPTSEEVLELAPARTPAEVFNAMLQV